MKRRQLVELEDEPWLPASLRDAATDFLQFMIRHTRPYAAIVPQLRRALGASRRRQVVDLCSGGGGPWPVLLPEVAAGPEGAPPLTVWLTDRYPNLPAFQRAQAESGGAIRFRREPVDATAVPPELAGFRTLFSSFHHFPPEQARAILADAARRGEGIGVFEASQRSAGALAGILLMPLIVLLVTPFIRPFRLSRLFWTYLLPLVPLLVLFDGTVSCLRTYTPAELRELCAGLAPAGDYRWEAGEERGPGSPLPVTYLIGLPASLAGRSGAADTG